ncbi:MAG: hypothetical protein P8Q92_02820 [Pseudoprimorskyibacter sp.]|nr:hypothetical protein [Pseudoprimorskyibacter sp.]
MNADRVPHPVSIPKLKGVGFFALVKVMIGQGYNPSQHLWVQCIDVDRLAALMCYIQLSLWNVPAEVIFGNTLSWDIQEVWYTLAHHLEFWKYRLHRNEESLEVARSTLEQFSHQMPEPVAEAPTSQQTDAPAVKPTQLGFDF